MENNNTSLLEHFGKIEDPRIARKRLHSLIDIIAIAILAVLCGSEGWEDIESMSYPKASYVRIPLRRCVSDIINAARSSSIKILSY